MAIKTSTAPDGHEKMQLSKIKLPDDFSNPMVEWLKNPKDILLYVGKAGCGKTYFCMAVINFLKELGLPQIYVHEQEFLGHFKECIAQSKSYEHDLEVYVEQPFLIYDDMGFGKITEWQQEIMYKLIDGRVKNRLPTIITINYI
jgi:DNA replication protein DnaC